jgi:hypothetical protein
MVRDGLLPYFAKALPLRQLQMLVSFPVSYIRQTESCIHTHGTFSKKTEWYLTATVRTRVTQHVIMSVEDPEGAVLTLSHIFVRLHDMKLCLSERVDRIVFLVIVPLKRKTFV